MSQVGDVCRVSGLFWFKFFLERHAAHNEYRKIVKTKFFSV